MDFESPDVAKEFPGLYMGEGGKGKAMSNPVDFDEESEKKKKKEKKDSKKDKGYAALAGESSHDEDETLDSKSPGKVKKLKTFKLSTKKKDKKSSGEKDKEKDRKSSEKEIKKSEKEKKAHDKDKEKEKKSHDRDKDKDRKLSEKDKEKDAPKSAEKETIRPRRPFSGENLHIIKDAHKATPSSQVISSSVTAMNSSVNTQISSPFEAKDVPCSSGAVVSTLKEKTSALNAFLNAPAPIFTKKKHKDNKDGKADREHKEKKDKDKDKDKKDKEHKESKKDKDHGVSKVKLKLKRSKNSLEDSQSGDFPITTSHQFPEDPDSIAKEIRKYETLLEQTHTHIKGSKKVSKKQEEQLWELQRTLTQLKRKLRSVNALSSASSASIMLHNTVNVVHPVSKSSVEREIVPQKVTPVAVTAIKVVSDRQDDTENAVRPTKAEEIDVADPTLSIKEDDIALDFTLKTLSIKTVTKAVTVEKPLPILSPPPKVEKAVEIPEIANVATPKSSTAIHPSRILNRRSLDLSELPNNSPISIIPIPEQENSEEMSHESNIESPKQELERVQVFVQVHHKEKSLTPEPTKQSVEMDDDIEDIDIPDGEVEIMENVVDDANKMIGSIHEELEAAAIVFGAADEFVSSTPKTAFASRNNAPFGSQYRRNSQGEEYISTTVPRVFALGPYEDDNKIITSKSEPTLGDRQENRNRIELFDASLEDYENDSDFEFLDDHDLSDPFSMPIFETEEYLYLENEALISFNESLHEEIRKEEVDIQALVYQLDNLRKHGGDSDLTDESLDFEDYHMDELIALWQLTKSENEALHENVDGLKLLVAASKLEQFQLETRLKYLEDRVTAISPLTMTTPLQTDV